MGYFLQKAECDSQCTLTEGILNTILSTRKETLLSELKQVLFSQFESVKIWEDDYLSIYKGLYAIDLPTKLPIISPASPSTQVEKIRVETLENPYSLTMRTTYKEVLHLKFHSSHRANPMGYCTIHNKAFPTTATKTKHCIL